MLGRWYGLAVAVTLLFLLGSCASGGNDVRQAPQSPVQSGLTGLPELPFEPYLTPAEIAERSANVLRTDMRIGRDTSERGGVTTEVTGRTLDIGNFSPGALSWATYQFDGYQHWDTVAGIGISIVPLVQPGTPTELWLAYADFSGERWVLQRLEVTEDGDATNGEGQVVGIDPQHDAISPSGNVYVAVLTYGTPVRVDSVDLIYDEVLPPPLGLTATEGTVEGRVVLSWLDPAITYDPDGPDHPGEFDYHGIWVERSTAPDSPGEQWERVANLIAGETEFVDGSDFAPLDSEITYYYRLRTALVSDGSGLEFIGGRPSPVVAGRAGSGLVLGPDFPEPIAEISGIQGSWQIVLKFVIEGGTPNFRLELDPSYDDAFEGDPNLPIILVKDFLQSPNQNGEYTLVVNLPAQMSAGDYIMALRVTDQSVPPKTSALVFPVTLSP